MKHRLPKKAYQDIQRRFEIDETLLEIMGLVVAEWESEPLSAQCFDRRTVSLAKDLWRERNLLQTPFDHGGIPWDDPKVQEIAARHGLTPASN